MGGGRAPCCDKNNVKKGPWSPAEDLRLAAFIQKHGHGNWRSLPKQAGLLRCGKSCRLRWINYLSPNVKRGNFTAEEEETIIKLHGSFGNKWSKIATQLPGRTDNEIKNVWNTHLKKRLLGKDSKCHEDVAKPKDAMISPPSPSSSTTSNVTCGDQKPLIDQDSIAKRPTDEQKDATRTSSSTSNISNSANSSNDQQVDVTKQEMDSLLNSEGLSEVRNNADNEMDSLFNLDGLNEICNNADSEIDSLLNSDGFGEIRNNVDPSDVDEMSNEFPMDSEFDIWSLLENLESFEAPQEEKLVASLQSSTNFEGDTCDMNVGEQSEWWKYLENIELELVGLIGEGQNQINPLKKAAETDHEEMMTLEPPIDPFRPPSPHNI